MKQAKQTITMIAPLVTTDSDGTYSAVRETVQWISELEEPFGVFVVAGKFRTGKSYLLNRLLDLPPDEGFGVGNTVQACTRGIWICKKMLTGADGRKVLVVDTEGIDALDVDSTHDARIFAAAVLLGSAFCYNSTSHIDEAAMQTLSFMSRITASVSNSHHPSLYWILRDFSLQMTDDNGKTITPSEYLEAALTSPPASKCETRDAIRAIFSNRHLVALPRPHKGQNVRIDGGLGNAKFERYLAIFRDHVTANVPFVSAGDVVFTGALYADYIHETIRCINKSDAVPIVKDVWSLISGAQHAQETRRLELECEKDVLEGCPKAEEKHVRDWILAHCKSQVERATFMTPSPDCTQIVSHLFEHVWSRCRATLVVDEDDIAANQVSAAVDVILADTGNWTPALEVIAQWESDAGEQKSLKRAKHMVCALVDAVWPSAQKSIKERAELDASRSWEMHVNQLHVDLEQSKRAEAALQVEMEDMRQSIPSKDDVSTDTCDLLAPEEAVESDVNVEGLSQQIAGVQELLSDAARREEYEYNRAETATEEVSRLRETVSTLETGLEELHSEAASQVKRHKADANSASEALKRVESQNVALREHLETNDRAVREMNDKMVDMHRLSVEDTRRRDEEERTNQTSIRNSQMQLEVRVESSERESRGLKRRVDELLQTEKETRREYTRVQTELSRILALRAGEEGEVRCLKSSLSDLKSERETLRATNAELSNRVAVLDATGKLAIVRKGLWE